MIRNKNLCFAALTGSALISSVVGAGVAQAGGFAVREQSAYFQGMGFAGSAAGGDISSMYWNPAAAAALPGFNDSENAAGIFGSSKLTATNGLLLNSLEPNTADIGTNNLVASSYTTYQVNDRLWIGVSLNAPFGFITKPDDRNWAGSAAAVTSKVFSLEATPTAAYKITPELTIGAGVQVEYVKVRLTRDGFDGIVPYRAVKADDWGVGGTVGLIWEPAPGTSLGVGYRSAVSVDVSGGYLEGPSLRIPTGLYTHGSASLTLPDEVTGSVRQALNSQWTALATVEWQNWSRVGNVPITSGAFGTLETLNLNYRDGWFFSVGAEYAWSQQFTVRGGVAYEISPISDRVRDILLPDSDRIHLNIGGSYRVSERAVVNVAYTHIFFDDAPFCVALPTRGTTHCIAGEPVALQGSSDNSVDILSASLNFQLSAPTTSLETYKK
jgi:long-chain fatty acid transport protein